MAAEIKREVRAAACDAAATWRCIADHLERLDRMRQSPDGPYLRRTRAASIEIIGRMVESLRASTALAQCEELLLDMAYPNRHELTAGLICSRAQLAWPDDKGLRDIVCRAARDYEMGHPAVPTIVEAVRLAVSRVALTTAGQTMLDGVLRPACAPEGQVSDG